MSGAWGRRANLAIAAALLIALPILTQAAMPNLLTGRQYQTLCLATAFAIGALSLNLLLGYTGQLSLGHGALLGVGAFTSGFITSRADLPMFVGLALSIVVASLVAAILGIVALRLRGMYLAVVTLAFATAMQYGVFDSALLSRGSAGVALPRRLWGSHYIVSNGVYLAVCLVGFLLVWAVDGNVVRTRLGRAFRAIKENESVAQSLGVSVVRYKLLAFATSGGMAGLAGALYCHTFLFVNGETFQFQESLVLVAAVVLGGQGRRVAVAVAGFSFFIWASRHECGSVSRVGPPATLVWQDVLDGSEREHDEAEGGVGGVEAVGPVDDEPDAPIEAFVAGIVDAESNGRQYP